MKADVLHRKENIKLIAPDFYKLVNVRNGINLPDLIKALRLKFPSRNVNKYQIQHHINKGILVGVVEIVSTNPKCYRRVL